MADDFILDLDADRERRSAEREGGNKGLPIKMGGRVVATLAPELPMDVLEPLRAIDQDLALLLRQAMVMAQGGNTLDATGLVIDLLASNPKLPTIFLDTLNECAVRLLGEEGVTALIEYRPTALDIAALAKGVAGFYGFSLGESSPSSTPQEEDAGEPSSATSSGTTESTPVASTRARKPKAS